MGMADAASAASVHSNVRYLHNPRGPMAGDFPVLLWIHREYLSVCGDSIYVPYHPKLSGADVGTDDALTSYDAADLHFCRSVAMGRFSIFGGICWSGMGGVYRKLGASAPPGGAPWLEWYCMNVAGCCVPRNGMRLLRFCSPVFTQDLEELTDT